MNKLIEALNSLGEAGYDQGTFAQVNQALEVESQRPITLAQFQIISQVFAKGQEPTDLSGTGKPPTATGTIPMSVAKGGRDVAKPW